MLPIIEKGKCLGCTETARDSDVLHCFLCKKHFHVMNCAVVATLDRDVLPAKTNLTNYIKYCSQSYPTGNFIWTCFRCGVIKELSSSDNINQRVAVLESLLMTLSPALTALAKSADQSNEISSMVSAIRSSTAAHPSSTADGNDGDPACAIETPSSESELASNANNLPMSQTVAVSPHNDGSTDQGQLPNPPVSSTVEAPIQIADDGCLDDTSQLPVRPLTDHNMHPKPVGSKIKIRITSDKENGPLLRTWFHRAHTAGKIDSYSIRYHSNHKADLIFQNASEAENAHQRISQLDLDQVNLGIPTCMNTKMVHVVGLTEEDSKDSIYKAICKPGRNHAIGHLINPRTFRVVKIDPCNRNHNVYRASVVISHEIWDIILNKMNSKLKIDYLSCSVFLRPDSIRCYNCQHLGHTAQTCQEDKRCVNCGQGHSSEGCQNTPKCINCFEQGVDCSHRADSPDCPTYKSFRKGSAKN